MGRIFKALEVRHRDKRKRRGGGYNYPNELLIVNPPGH